MFLIDSHIHLFPQSHLPTLAWYSSGNPLASQHSVHEYRIATAGPVRGFIFLETDRISSVQESEHSWAHVLDEVSLLTRIALGQPIPGEGHDPLDASLCLGIIPWAPVPGGPAVLEKYMGLVKQRTQTDAVWKKVRGIRYLVQDKPAGTMLEPQFVDGLKWLGKKGFTFDLGVDARQGGLWQLREAVEMMGRVYEDAEATFVVSMLFLSLSWRRADSFTRSPLQTQSASLWFCCWPSRFCGVEVPGYIHGPLSQGLHETLWRVL